MAKAHKKGYCDEARINFDFLHSRLITLKQNIAKFSSQFLLFARWKIKN